MTIKKIIILFTLILFFAACARHPSRHDPVPTQQQLEWQQLETYAFIHFGLNTFNDMEWGYGDTPAETFNPSDLDCEQWVLTLKACGMKGVILTAKHHDGFCLWPTETTDYSIKNSPYKNGQGDVVGELCEACRKHGLKFGLYLSPWDRHQAEYGRSGYVEIYHRQIKELTDHYGPLFEFWFDGANGGDGWYGGAKETRSIVAENYYDYEKARGIVWKNNPDAMIFGGTVPTIRWIGNEEGRAGATLWSAYHTDFASLNDTKSLSVGFSDGEAWIPAEVDVSIRPGWFYHENENPKSLEQLLDIYYQSVGRNANLLLNFPVNQTGRISKEDSLRAMEWHQAIEGAFAENLLKGCKVIASNTRSHRFSPKHVLCDEYTHYWATEDGINKAELVFGFPETTSINTVVLKEYIPLGQNVKAFNISYYCNGKWLPVVTDETMTTIGYKRIVRFQTIHAEKLRIRFLIEKGTLCVSQVGAYNRQS
ncbi:MAG: alpha-L-fucosidase [Bacteroidales bacterium]|nr:alpha-L-fucosidase [Bacteroidales bacterium]